MRLIPLGIMAALSIGCTPSPSALDPHGPAAAKITAIWWIMASIAFVVFLVVIVTLLYGIQHKPRGENEFKWGPLSDTTWIGIGGTVLSTLILIGMMGIDISTNKDVAMPPQPATVSIEVIGHQYWWEIRYPDAQVTTANEIHIPVGQVVDVAVSSPDVIHSLWVPQLQGKADLIPGHPTSTWIEADEAGVYRGQCSEYCGAQHAHMAFYVTAEPLDQFEDWLNDQRQPASEPADPQALQGMETFAKSVCVTCHTIRGTEAVGKVGPDLTHLGSRRWIAAGTLPNTPDDLARWISDPQQVKPGNKMPYFGLDPQSDFVRSVVAYLESLK